MGLYQRPRARGTSVPPAGGTPGTVSRGLTGTVARGLTGTTRSDDGMSTAEYAVGTVAACGFAALLFKILTSSQVRGLVVDIVTRALNLAG